jgi:hypothetical protein
MVAALHSEINSLKYGLIHLIGQLNSQKGGSAKVRDRNISETKFFSTI